MISSHSRGTLAWLVALASVMTPAIAGAQAADGEAGAARSPFNPDPFGRPDATNAAMLAAPPSPAESLAPRMVGSLNMSAVSRTGSSRGRIGRRFGSGRSKPPPSNDPRDLLEINAQAYNMTR